MPTTLYTPLQGFVAIPVRTATTATGSPPCAGVPPATALHDFHDAADDRLDRGTFAMASLILVVLLTCLSFVVVTTTRALDLSAIPAGLPDGGQLLMFGSLIEVGLAMLVLNAWLQARSESAGLRDLIATIERQAGAASPTPLSTEGSAAISRLARAINDCRRQHAERTAEHLDVLAAFAHDLRAPLTRIGLRCERVREQPLREAMDRDLAEIGSLVDGSLACARTLRVPEPLRRVDADGLLGSLVCDYQDAGRAIRLEGRIGAPVTTCPKALRRVLVNLIDNGLRHGDVCLSVRHEAGRLVLAVADTGPGIAPSELESVFTPWYRALGSAERGEGSGLGLAIARRLARSMRGELQLENRREGGLEARLTLPLAIA